MTNVRSLLLITLALGILSNLSACAAQKISETLPSASRTSITQPDGKVRYRKVRLSFREQKPGTEAQLQRERQVQQELLQKRAELKKASRQAATATNEAALKRSDAVIVSFFENPILTEKNVVDAYPDSSTNSTIFSIGLKFDAEGSKAFAALTKKLAGTGRAIGIFLNDRLISDPMVSSQYAQTGITGGTAMITGNFSAQQAKDLAAQLNPK
jgi:preprotein translocase subunit SecD